LKNLHPVQRKRQSYPGIADRSTAPEPPDVHLEPNQVDKISRNEYYTAIDTFASSISLGFERLIRNCITNGRVNWTDHALQRCSKWGLTTGDCVNALKSGTVDPAEWEKGTWRYRVRAGRITVVIAFRDMRTLTVITIWT
jgi:hypothetical protein